ncbi:MAG: GGDEF domain-containing protein [Acidobacteriaceae bacterium]
MRRLSLALVLVIAFSGKVLFSQDGNRPSPTTSVAVLSSLPLRTVAQIRALPTSEAANGVPVELRATLTYYEPGDGLIFAQDATGGIFVVAPPHAPALQAGDVAVITGKTTPPNFAVNIQASQIRFERAGPMPKPVPVTWREMMHSSEDCVYVSITGSVRSATVQMTDSPRGAAPVHTAGNTATNEGDEGRRRYILMDLQTEGGAVRVHMEDTGRIDPMALLDSQVRLNGVAGGIFDGEYRQIGAELWMSSAQHMTVLEPAASDPAKLPLTSINQIMSGYFARDESQRVHVRGSLTLYQPGLQLVLQTPNGQAVLVSSYEQAPLHIGQVVDVVGFPDPNQYSEVLKDGSVLPSEETKIIPPATVTWTDALAGHYPYGLVSMEGRIAAEVHERHQDTLVIQSGSHVFSAIFPRTVWDRALDESALPDYRVGSTVRVTGVCVVHAGGPWNTERWFDLQLRSPQDVAVLVDPPWWTVRRLLYVSASLLLLMIAALFWAMALQRKVRKQTEQIRLTMESEAARERRIAFLEKERGRVLEAINSMLNLDEVLLMILRLISTQLEERSCWCELANGTLVGEPGTPEDADRVVRRGIYSGAGERLGSLVVSGAEAYQEQAGEALEMGASLAALAIDNRRLYETLIHRSQYDQLTNAANRFLLESRLDEALAHARRGQSHFALIYMDLDQFKQVNDFYGHRVGDLYLQQVAERVSEKLRGMDTLARVGGDEFISLLPVVRGRAEVEEITQRLLRCFDAPFHIDTHILKGSVSIGYAVYPEDGITKDELKRVADAAMYANKPHASV